MEELTYHKAEKIFLKQYYSEKWLQDRIEEDPSILGLGDLVVIQREKRQSTGGRIDFLFLDNETETMYETEIMLGSTDESHIIRTIEYWDIERRRYPSKDHKAVIVAEDITNRFFNVIALMNRSIPIIAVQLNALKLCNKILLDFVKILDIYEQPEDEDNLVAEPVDRAYWENRSNPKSMAIVDSIIASVSEMSPDVKISYNKSSIAIGTSKRNFAWFFPRKKEGYCVIDLRTGKENNESVKQVLDELSISFKPRPSDILAIFMYSKELQENKEKINEIFQVALASYS